MGTADDVREVGLALPRTYESFTGGRFKLKVGQVEQAARASLRDRAWRVEAQ